MAILLRCRWRLIVTSDNKIQMRKLDRIWRLINTNTWAWRTLPAQPISNEIVSVQQVSKRYTLGKQTVNALHEVTLSIGKGEFIAITGASGSGKSTLLQIIGCLDKPMSGRVAVESKERQT